MDNFDKTVICPYCGFDWDNSEQNHDRRFKCLKCGTTWSLSQTAEDLAGDVSVISVGDWDDWEVLELQDRIIRKFWWNKAILVVVWL